MKTQTRVNWHVSQVTRREGGGRERELTVDGLLIQQLPLGGVISLMWAFHFSWDVALQFTIPDCNEEHVPHFPPMGPPNSL